MKFKKMLTVLFTSVLLLSFSSSANAAAGFADTEATAFLVQPTAAGEVVMRMSLSSANDKDWYKWKNTSGKGKYISSLFVPSGASRYTIGNKLVYENGLETDIFYSGQSMIKHIYVPPNATLYVIMSSLEFLSPEDFYFLLVVDEDLG